MSSSNKKHNLETKETVQGEETFETITSVFRKIRWQPYNINSMLEHREI